MRNPRCHRGAELPHLSHACARRRGSQVGQGQDRKRRQGGRHYGGSHWEHGVKRQHGFDPRFRVKLAYEALRVAPSILVIAFFAATNRLTSAWQRSKAARASAISAGLPPAFTRSKWAIAPLERIKRSRDRILSN
jgi:hypothetical protein